MSTTESLLGIASADRDDIILTVLDNMIWPILAVVILGIFLTYSLGSRTDRTVSVS